MPSNLRSSSAAKIMSSPLPELILKININGGKTKEQKKVENFDCKHTWLELLDLCEIKLSCDKHVIKNASRTVSFLPSSQISEFLKNYKKKCKSYIVLVEDMTKQNKLILNAVSGNKKFKPKVGSSMVKSPKGPSRPINLPSPISVGYAATSNNGNGGIFLDILPNLPPGLIETDDDAFSQCSQDSQYEDGEEIKANVCKRIAKSYHNSNLLKIRDEIRALEHENKFFKVHQRAPLSMGLLKHLFLDKYF